jgi:hypothetical protein
MAIHFNSNPHPTPLNLTVPQTGSTTCASKSSVSTDQLRILAHTNSSNCFSNLLDKLKTSFHTLYEWILSFFVSDLPSDPALLARWDQIVEKDYDPIGATQPYYTEAANACARGHTLADSLVRAASKTGMAPSFQHIIIMKKSGAGLLFTGDGQFTRLAARAATGEFNSPNTLIITALSNHLSENEKQNYIQGRIRSCALDGFPIHHATMLVISGNELSSLERDRMPSSLLQFFKTRTRHLA